MRAKRTVSTLLIMLLLSYTTTALMGMFLLQEVTALEPTITMWVTPPTRVFEKGSTFNITIWLNDTADPDGPWQVKAWVLTLNFDNSIINFVRAIEGPYLKKGGLTTFVGGTPGAVPVNLACVISSYSSVDGPGELVTVTFEVRDNGRAVIDLKDTELRYFDAPTTPVPASAVDGVFYTTYPKARFFYLPSTTAQSVSGVPTPFHLVRDPFVNETVTFNATAYMIGATFRGSYDPNTATETNPTGTITNYAWDFDDGNVTSGPYPVITHSFDTTNLYNVNLTVTDDEAKSTWFSSSVAPIIRDVGISSIKPAKPAISPNATLSIKVNITNYGTIAGSEFVNVTLYYNNGVSDTLIPYNVTRGLKAWSNVHENDPISKTKPMLFLSGEPPITLNYTWYTKGLPNGNYTIWANISQVNSGAGQFLKDLYFREMDLNLTNNNMTWGRVKISKGHDIAITKIDLTPTLKSPNIINYGTNQVTIKVNATNIGDFDETFNVTLHQDSNLLAEWKDEFLASKASKILEYTWVTSALSRGYYNLIAQASNVTKEVENGLTDDNKLPLKTIITSAPTATFTYSPAKPLVGDTINIDATVSHAAPGWSISTYTWRVNSTIDPTLTTATIELRFVSRAVWNITLTVADNTTLSSSFSQLIHLGSLPVAQFTFTPTAPKVDQTITFNASASFPDTPPLAGDEIKTYAWNFSDGTKVLYTGANLTKTTTHSFAKSGNFSVTLKVFDGEDFNSTITRFVVVARITSGVTISLNTQTMEVGQSVTISGQVTPPRLGAKVSILYKTDTTSWTLLQNVTSDQAGNYQHIWTINTAGNYTVKARFAADDKYTTSESQTATIQVQSTPPPSTPDWTPYIIGGGIAIIVVIAVAVYLMRRRK